jgi:hypothetical protein
MIKMRQIQSVTGFCERIGSRACELFWGTHHIDKEARISILRKFSDRFSHSFRKLFHSSMEKEKDEFPRLDKSQFFKREKVLVLTLPVLKVSENVSRLKKVCLFFFLGSFVIL